MEQKFKFSSQSGMSLIGVIMASTIMSFLALSTANLIINQAASVSYLEDRLSKVSLETIIKANVQDYTACTNTIAVRPFSNISNVTTLKDKSNNQVLPSMGYDKINITGMALQNVNMTGTPGETAVMNLIVNINRDRTGGGPSDLAPIVIPLNVSTDPTTNNIISCGGVGGFDLSSRNCSYTTNIDQNGRRIPPTTFTVDEGEGYQIVSRSGTSSSTSSFLCINGRNVPMGVSDSDQSTGSDRL